jgi:hypothetical protein
LSEGKGFSRRLLAMKKSDKEFWRELMAEPFVKKHYEIPEEFLLVQIDEHLMVTLLKQKMFSHKFDQAVLDGPYHKLNLYYPDWLQEQRSEGRFKGSFVNLVLNGSYYSITLPTKKFEMLPMGMPKLSQQVKLLPSFAQSSATVSLFSATLEKWQSWSVHYGFTNSFRLEKASAIIDMSGQDYEDSFYALCLMIQENAKPMKLKGISYQISSTD